jgi:hypothetical protein
MKKIKFVILSFFIVIWIYVWNIFAIDVQVPNSQWNQDIIVTWPPKIHTDESTIFEIIQIINQYLWFSVWLFCMVLLVIGGFKLISAEWDTWKTKKANTIISWAIVWIMICILSYAAVRILVNLFS